MCGQSGAGHPSVSPRIVPSGGVRARAALAACALALLAAAVAGAARADPPASNHKPKASSFAPRHTQSHTYGTPIAKPYLHKRRKPAPAKPQPAPIK